MTLSEVEYITEQELDIKITKDDRWHVDFSRCEIKDGCILISEYGGGPTKKAAMANYAKKLSWKTIVINAYGSDRKEFKLPEVTA